MSEGRGLPEWELDGLWACEDELKDVCFWDALVVKGQEVVALMRAGLKSAKELEEKTRLPQISQSIRVSHRTAVKGLHNKRGGVQCR